MLYFLSDQGKSLQNCVLKPEQEKVRKKAQSFYGKIIWIKNLRFESERGIRKSFGGKFSSLKILQFYKGPKQSKKTKSFGRKMFLGWKYRAFKRDQKSRKKN